MKTRTLACKITTLLSLFVFILLGGGLLSGKESGKGNQNTIFAAIEERVREFMEESKIPGLSLVIVKGNDPVYIKGFGFADLEKKIPVTPAALFEIGSCSKAFTGLAVLRLEKEGLLKLDDPVSRYFPWFFLVYEGKKYQVTLRQALHHTTGIRPGTLSLIPRGNHKNALEQTVKNLVGVKLENPPGTRFRYATVNYDILGAIIEKVSGMTYEDYLAANILRPLGLNDTIVGVDKNNPPPNKAAGYKIGFFSPRKYDPPVYRGNNPAAYVISNAKDMARWLKLQLGLVKTGTLLDRLIRESHQPDLSVRPDAGSLTSYGGGWFINQFENGGIFHGGLNPNFTAYIHFNRKDEVGVVVMANSNSRATYAIGRVVMRLLYRQEVTGEFNFGDAVDKSSSVISFIMAIIVLSIIIYILSIVIDILRGRRRYGRFTLPKALKAAAVPVLLIPFLWGIYLLPKAIQDVSWETAIVWSPVSFPAAVCLILLSIGIGYIAYIFSILFPQRNRYLKSLPMLIILSLLTGGANAVVIFLITGSLYSNTELFYQLYYFGLVMILYIWGRKMVQTRLIRITFDIVYDLRLRLIEKIFYTSYEKFEKIDRGRILATLNDDTGQIGGTANIFVSLITSMITAVGAFIYLATIAFWATMVTSVIIVIIATLYYIVSRRTNRYFNQARDTQNVYMGLLDGLVDGFKELSLHLKKRDEYKADIEDSCDQFRQKSSTARIKFLHAFLIGESLLIVVLGAVGFAVPRLFPQITTFTLMSFIMVLLYLIGPINSILTAIPTIMQLKVAWERVREFLEDIPANIDPAALVPLRDSDKIVDGIQVRGLTFYYKNEHSDETDEEDQEETFSIGPIDFQVQKGEVVFIVGGNGSGKTTLAKVLTGLYAADNGAVEINGKPVSNNQLGEYFSTVFGDYHLFEKLYEIDLTKKAKEAHRYLKMLRLQDKVEFVNNSFSTIDLSGGQKKRLALLRCYLEDAPIFLFDEVAADQDPTFRKFFYRDLLYRMREMGKIVIAITHDDHYFDAADRVIKMDMGRIESIDSGYKYRYKITA